MRSVDTALHPLSSSAERTSSSPRRHVMWRRTVPLVVASLPFVFFILLPLVALVVNITPASVFSKLVDPTVAQAIRLSLNTTSVTLCLTLLGGTPLAFLLSRRQFRGRAALDTLLTLPIVMPPAVAGIALLLAFGRRGIIGQFLNDFGIDIAFTPVAVILAQTFVAAPFYIQTAKTAFSAVDRQFEHAAALDGAGPLRIFRAIILPLSLPALFGGAVMTWARALGEFGATIIFAGNFQGLTQTMPLAIYLGFELDLQAALTLSLVLLIFSFAILFLVRVALRQRVEEYS